jgi:hypothetical protein
MQQPLKTTLVLGAGASCDVGYPSGKKLRERILTTIDPRNGLCEAALKAGFAEAEIVAFAEDLSAATNPTIDEFLEQRPNLLNTGRFSIAHELTMYENVPIRQRATADTW